MRNLTCNTPDTQLTASAGPSTRVLLWCLSLQPVDNPQVRCRRGTRERARGRGVSNAAQRRHSLWCSGVGEWDRNRRNLGFESQHTIHSPCQPTTPVGSRPASPALRLSSEAFESPKSSLGSECTLISPRPVPPADRHGVLSQLDLASAGFSYESKQHAFSSRASLPINPNALRMSPAQEEKLVSVKETTRSQRRASFHTRIFSSSRHSEVKDHRVGSDGTDEMDHASTENNAGISVYP